MGITDTVNALCFLSVLVRFQSLGAKTHSTRQLKRFEAFHKYYTLSATDQSETRTAAFRKCKEKNKLDAVTRKNKESLGGVFMCQKVKGSFLFSTISLRSSSA